MAIIKLKSELKMIEAAFKSLNGLFEWLVMPFNLSDTPNIFIGLQIYS